MKKWFFVLSLLCISCVGADTEDLFFPHTLMSVKNSGKTVRLEDNSKWKVSSGAELVKNWGVGDTIRLAPIVGKKQVKKYTIKNIDTDESVTVSIETIPSGKSCLKVKKVREAKFGTYGSSSSLVFTNGEEFIGGQGAGFFMWEKGDPVILMDMDQPGATRAVMNYRNGQIVWVETRVFG